VLVLDWGWWWWWWWHCGWGVLGGSWVVDRGWRMGDGVGRGDGLDGEGLADEDLGWGSKHLAQIDTVQGVYKDLGYNTLARSHF